MTGGAAVTPGETGPVPIGLALPGVRAYIVDESMNEVAPCVPGELLIGGVQVARGYLGRDELTRLIWGACVSLTVAIGAQIIIVLICVTLGLVSGF